MTVLQQWAKTLTVEDVLGFVRYGIGCKECPANFHCVKLMKEHGEPLHGVRMPLCFSYHDFAKYLESEARTLETDKNY